MKKILPIISTVIVVAILIVGIILYIFLKNVSRQTNRPLSYFFTTLSQAQKNKKQFVENSVSILVLGLDRRNDLLEQTETTDTIILANIDLKTSRLNFVSIPRDLWSYSTNTKINYIYPLSKETPNQFSYIQDEFIKITGQKITKTIIISTENLIDFVNLIGGVDINLENGFVDEKYPNPDYIANPSPSIPIYKTISFPSGLNHLDESNITEFVRSRRSAETTVNGGTDLGRIIRQQLLIEAIIQKIGNSDFIKNQNNLIKLYNFWQKAIETNINDTDILTWLLSLGQNIKNISIQKSNIPTAEYPDTSIIYHPKKFINPQWVYIPLSDNYQELHDFINQSFSEN